MTVLGSGQSPIDLSDWVESDGLAPTFEYASEAVRVERAQGFVIVHFDRGSRLRIGDAAYRLLQLHWHTPAEHAIAGREFAAEVHFVHLNAREELLVVGAIYRRGEPDDGLQRIIHATPAAGQEADFAPSLSAADHAPESDGFFHYTGSLTAPPFSEPVQWYIGRTVNTVSQRQVEDLQTLAGGPNARALQDRNARAIHCVGCAT